MSRAERTVFVIGDEAHQDIFWEFAFRDDALVELNRLAGVPWDERPNVAPCTSWKECGRSYELIEYDTSAGTPWREVSRFPMLDVSAREVRWIEQ